MSRIYEAAQKVGIINTKLGKKKDGLRRKKCLECGNMHRNRHNFCSIKCCDAYNES